MRLLQEAGFEIVNMTEEPFRFEFTTFENALIVTARKRDV
jgi:hypothetical protein